MWGFRENIQQFIQRVHFFDFVWFLVEIWSHTLIPLYRPGSVHIGLASWDDCGWMILDKLHVSLFPDRFPHYACTVAQSAHSNFIGSRTYACLGATCLLHFWQNECGLFQATVVTQGWNRRKIRVSLLVKHRTPDRKVAEFEFRH